MIKLALRAAALLVLAGAIASCGGAAPAGAKMPMEPAAKDDASGTPEGALAALNVAESTLFQALGSPVAPAAPAQPGFAQAPAASAAPMAPPPPPPAPGVAQAAAEPARPGLGPAPTKAGQRGEHEAPRSASDPCSTACSALASMERAADHLCGLAGAGDNRCQSARDRVKNATARVHAACPACGR